MWQSIRAVRRPAPGTIPRPRRLPLVELLLGSSLAMLLGASTALAADACLAGSAELGDQRALAAVRTATETKCPCATVASHKAYVACGRGAVTAAIQGGTLRGECETTARSIFRDSTCGARNRVACGRVYTDGTVGCTIRKAAACRSRTRFAARACTTLSHCTDVVQWTAGTCTDVRAMGAYGVGARIITYTKPSQVDPLQPRALPTTIWYPTPPTTNAVDPSTGGVLDAPVATGGPFPVLMFSHGSCGIPNQSTFLTTLLASRGFIVAAPPHPGNTLLEFPNCGTPGAQAASFAERPRDIIHVLDQLLAANQDAGSPFFGAIDPQRVGMSGHSFGGLTTYLTVQADSRFIAAMPMAPATLTQPALTIPSLFLVGVIDSVVNNAATRQAYDRSSAPKHYAGIRNTGHYAFSGACFPSADCNPPVTLTQAEAHANVLRYAIPFLETHVAGDASFRPFLAAPAPPGFDFEAVP
jgi:dienelactone hydrolase